VTDELAGAAHAAEIAHGGLRGAIAAAAMPRGRCRAAIEAAHWAYGAAGGAAFAALPEGVRRRAWAGPASELRARPQETAR
jgi:hypothetical protein